MTPPMVERVARALFLKWDARAGSSLGAYEDVDETAKDYWRDQARAAIEAMREPTMQQEIEGKAALIFGRRVHGNDVCPSPNAVYVAMIDAAINEGK